MLQVDPQVLAALPEDLRREIVQTIPLEKDSLFVVGNDKLPKKRLYTAEALARPPAGLIFFEVLSFLNIFDQEMHLWRIC